MYQFKTPTSSKEEFLNVLETSIGGFLKNPMAAKLDEGRLQMEDYHNLLTMLFHQVYASSGSFALAAANCSNDYSEARDYLLKHAAEERTHWQWILNDLQNTGYNGIWPTEQFPPTACQAYRSFNYDIAVQQPLARLGIAAMLENLGANLGKKYGTKLIEQLKITPDKATFLFGHGDTDIGHTKEIIEVLEKSKPNPVDWGWLTFAAKTAVDLYFSMYIEASRLSEKSKAA